MKQKFWLPLVFSLVLVLGLWIGYMMAGPRHIKTHGQEKLVDVINRINEYYVDPVDIDSLVEMAIPALLQNLDPHSSYIPAKDFENVNNELESKFSGIGISFQILNDTLSVIEVITGGPAEKVGVMPGDRIIKVDDRDIANKKIKESDVFSMLRGEKGTHVTIQVKRSTSKEPITFEITRDDIPVESVTAVYMIEPTVGYINVGKFARNTYFEFLQALNKLRLEGATSYIIDLRYNTGGYMDPAVMMANEFLDPGSLIVSTRGRNKAEDQFIVSDGTGVFRDANLAVLVNEFSASASEIFSGAIQDNDRGWIVGRRTFGKGLVQHPILLPDSSEMRLTVQRYYTPSGRSIQKDYKPGDNYDYEAELVNRFNNGENLNADSIHQKTDLLYNTVNGRAVYGGGGIMPDIFVPEDTAYYTSYYASIMNQNLPTKFAYEYCDLNRSDLQKAKTVDEVLKRLPSNDVLLNSFVNYAKLNGVPARWYYINISSPLIVNHIKALIIRNMLGLTGYYEFMNRSDSTVQQALKQVKKPLLEVTD